MQGGGVEEREADRLAVADFGHVEVVARGFDRLGQKRSVWYWRGALSAGAILAAASVPAVVRLPGEPPVPTSGTTIVVGGRPPLGAPCVAAWDRSENAALRSRVRQGGPFKVVHRGVASVMREPGALRFVFPATVLSLRGCSIVAAYRSPAHPSGSPDRTRYGMVFSRSFNGNRPGAYVPRGDIEWDALIPHLGR